MSLSNKRYCHNPYSFQQTTKILTINKTQQQQYKSTNNSKNSKDDCDLADCFITEDTEIPLNWADDGDNQHQYFSQCVAENKYRHLENACLQRWNSLRTNDGRYIRTVEIVNNAFNIHSILASRVVTVPFCYASSRNYNLYLPTEFRDTAHLWPGGRAKLFFGHLPLVLVSTNLIALLVKAVTGVTPLRIYCTNPKGTAGRNSQNKATSSIVVVEVRDFEADLVIANINRRVLIDQTSFHVAITDEQVREMQRVTKLLEMNHSIRFNGRPYSTVLVNREQRADEPRQKNVNNPLCKCERCVSFKHTHTDYSFLMNTYIPDVLEEFTQDEEQQQPQEFQGGRLLLTHAYLLRENLTPEQNRFYCDVFPNRLKETRKMTAHAYATTEIPELPEDYLCLSEFTKRR